MKFDVLIIRIADETVSSIAAYDVPMDTASSAVAGIMLGLKPELTAIVVESGRFAKGDKICVEHGIQ